MFHFFRNILKKKISDNVDKKYFKGQNGAVGAWGPQQLADVCRKKNCRTAKNCAKTAANHILSSAENCMNFPGIINNIII